MAKAPSSGDGHVSDYRHADKRKNNPPAGIAAQGEVAKVPKRKYAYNPHLPPVLRFDASGASDKLPELLEAARTRALTADEAAILADALRVREPWLEWTGKREKKSVEVDPVALHIHERVSAQAILKVAARENVQRDLFADPVQSYKEAVQFYQHDVDWSNRLILGDSLSVMSSLAVREGLAGKVQMIYVDPPYGIRFGSNFQPLVGRRDVKEKEADLTRDVEVVKAYRDTWTLGIHSYLAYLRDRLTVARDLLQRSGSVFVQIGDENAHSVQDLLDEVFGPENFVSKITFVKTTGASSPKAATNVLAGVSDYLLWYARDRSVMKYRPLFKSKPSLDPGGWVEFPNGLRRRVADGEVPSGGRPFGLSDLTSQTVREAATTVYGVRFQGREYGRGGTRGWATSPTGFSRLIASSRIAATGDSLRFVRYNDDFPVAPINNVWTDTIVGQFTEQKAYVVQTGVKVIERCMLMTTDPGDLVLDPTCGSGTTPYVAELRGRRWIAVDTSRVALAVARQRILTSSFDYFRLREPSQGVRGGFIYKVVPHITLKSIAQNSALDAIFARHEPLLSSRFADCNLALETVGAALRGKLSAKLIAKKKRKDKDDPVTDADERRWTLPVKAWAEWEVPFDTDSDWPQALQASVTAYRAAWRAMIDEVNAATAANAASDSQELVDQPEIDRKILRVSGPFTVEGVQPAEESLDLEDCPIAGQDEDLPTFEGGAHAAAVAVQEPANAEAYVDKMLRLLRGDGVRFPNNKEARFERLDRADHDVLHAEGDWTSGDSGSRRVAVVVGPQYGPVTTTMVEEALRAANRQGYDDLVIAGFSFDALAQAVIQEDAHPKVRTHLAHIRPDVQMDGLLKNSPQSQLFTVFGLPRSRVDVSSNGLFVASLEGIDIYDPVSGVVLPTGADKVAAWFLDSDYDGRTFCICQAFFPDRSAWDKIARALKGVVDEDVFVRLSGQVSLPFPAGQHRRIAVKAIDPRGNEVMRLHPLQGVK